MRQQITVHDDEEASSDAHKLDIAVDLDVIASDHKQTCPEIE
jgi:hypothetical protein